MLTITLVLSLAAAGADQTAGADPFLGRWDIMILDSGTTFNSCWWKVEEKDGQLQASMVWRWGSVVPAAEVKISGGEIQMARGKGRRKLQYRVRQPNNGRPPFRFVCQR